MAQAKGNAAVRRVPPAQPVRQPAAPNPGLSSSGAGGIPATTPAGTPNPQTTGAGQGKVTRDNGAAGVP